MTLTYIGAWAFLDLPVIRKVDELSSLPDGWHFGRGSAPSKAVILLAKKVAYFAASCGLSDMDAFPGKDGEITVAIYRKEEDHSFEIGLDLKFQYWNEDDPNGDIEDGLSFEDVIQRISALVGPKWNLSFISTSATGILRSNDSEVSRSKILATEVEYPWSILPAYTDPEVKVFAPTLVDFIQPSAQNLQFFGSLTNPYYQKAIA